MASPTIRPTRNPRSWLVRGAWLALLSLIFISAHSDNESPGGTAWLALAIIGVDISMTPITVDMNLMGAASSEETVPRRDLVLEITDSDAKNRVDIQSLRFHSERLPLFHLTDAAAHGLSGEAERFAVCKSLHRRWPTISGFTLRTRPEARGDIRYGFNREHSCSEFASRNP